MADGRAEFKIERYLKLNPADLKYRDQAMQGQPSLLNRVLETAEPQQELISFVTSYCDDFLGRYAEEKKDFGTFADNFDTLEAAAKEDQHPFDEGKLKPWVTFIPAGEREEFAKHIEKILKEARRFTLVSPKPPKLHPWVLQYLNNELEPAEIKDTEEVQEYMMEAMLARMVNALRTKKEEPSLANLVDITMFMVTLQNKINTGYIRALAQLERNRAEMQLFVCPILDLFIQVAQEHKERLYETPCIGSDRIFSVIKMLNSFAQLIKDDFPFVAGWAKGWGKRGSGLALVLLGLGTMMASVVIAHYTGGFDFTTAFNMADACLTGGLALCGFGAVIRQWGFTEKKLDLTQRQLDIASRIGNFLYEVRRAKGEGGGLELGLQVGGQSKAAAGEKEKPKRGVRA